MELEQLISTCKKKLNPDTDLRPFTKINWNHSLNIKQENLKLLEDNVGENWDDLGYEADF